MPPQITLHDLGHTHAAPTTQEEAAARIAELVFAA
jgi:hypothetical protein